MTETDDVHDAHVCLFSAAPIESPGSQRPFQARRAWNRIETVPCQSAVYAVTSLDIRAHPRREPSPGKMANRKDGVGRGSGDAMP